MAQELLDSSGVDLGSLRASSRGVDLGPSRDRSRRKRVRSLRLHPPESQGLDVAGEKVRQNRLGHVTAHQLPGSVEEIALSDMCRRKAARS